MKRQNKFIILLFGMVALVSILGACGKEKKEIVLWNPFTGADGEFFQQIVDEYNKTDPDYKVKNVIVPDMYTKIYTVMNSNKDKDVPDMTVIHAERVELFSEQSLIDPMDDVIKDQKNINSDAYIPQAWDSGEVNGKRYTVPLDVHTSVMYYNKDLVKKYGANVLDDNIVTFDEIHEIAKKAKADNKVTYPINVEMWTISALSAQQGSSIEKDGDPNLNSPEIKKSVEILKGLVDSGAAQEDGDDASQLFQSGESVFLQDGTWYSSSMEDTEIDWGVTNTPVISPDKLVNWTSSHQFGLLKKERSEEKKVELGKFLEFVRENSAVWADSGQNAASAEIYEAKEYKNRPQSFLMLSEKEKESLHIFDFAQNGNVMESLQTYARDMIYSRITVEEGLKEAQKLAEDKIKEGLKDEK